MRATESMIRRRGAALRISRAACAGLALAAAGAALVAAMAPAVPAAAAARPAPHGAWKVLDRIRLGGAGGWDYLTLDAAGSRLYISRQDHVDVMDTARRQVVGAVPDTQGVHGVALDEAHHRGFTSNGRADTVSEFDLQSLRVTRVLPVSGHNPDAILYEPARGRVFTFNGRSHDVTVLDAGSGAVLATLAVPGKPEFAVDDGAGHVYVNIESEPGQMTVIDSERLAVSATWPLPGCAAPTGLALDRRSRRLFSVCDAGVMAVTDADSGKAVARVKIGDGPDAAAFDPERGLVFSSNGEGTLTVVREESADRYRVILDLRTQRGARTLALDAPGNRLYLVTADFAPAPTPGAAGAPRPRPVPVPDSFTVLVVGPG